ncbi:MAG: hypothetical protein ABSE73_08210 [Planctomycetota bacterium]
MRTRKSKKSTKEAAPKAARKARKAKMVLEQPQNTEKTPEAPPAQEKAKEKAAPKALPVGVQAGTAHVETKISEQVGCHFVCQSESAPRQNFILNLDVADEETVKLVARYVKPVKAGTLVMAFLPKLTVTMRKKGAISQMPILAKHKGETCQVSWGVDQIADDLEATILDFLGAAKEPVHVDQIIEKTEKEAAKVLAALMVLEVRKLVRQLPGKKFTLAQ